MKINAVLRCNGTNDSRYPDSVLTGDAILETRVFPTRILKISINQKQYEAEFDKFLFSEDGPTFEGYITEIGQVETALFFRCSLTILKLEKL